MDSWAQTLDRAEIVLRYDIKDVMQTFNMLEYYSLDATQAYVQHIDNLNDYAQAEEQKRVVVKKYFLARNIRQPWQRLEIRWLRI